MKLMDCLFWVVIRVFLPNDWRAQSIPFKFFGILWWRIDRAALLTGGKQCEDKRRLGPEGYRIDSGRYPWIYGHILSYWRLSDGQLVGLWITVLLPELFLILLFPGSTNRLHALSRVLQIESTIDISLGHPRMSFILFIGALKYKYVSALL